MRASDLYILLIVAALALAVILFAPGGVVATGRDPLTTWLDAVERERTSTLGGIYDDARIRKARKDHERLIRDWYRKSNRHARE